MIADHVVLTSPLAVSRVRRTHWPLLACLHVPLAHVHVIRVHHELALAAYI
jgi:hypothetical protein